MPPEAVTEACPLAKLQLELLLPVVNIMGVGCITLMVFVATQFLLSVTVTV